MGGLNEQLALTRDESTAGLSIGTVHPGRFTGQVKVIRDGERIVPPPRANLARHSTVKPHDMGYAADIFLY